MERTQRLADLTTIISRTQARHSQSNKKPFTCQQKPLSTAPAPPGSLAKFIDAIKDNEDDDSSITDGREHIHLMSVESNEGYKNYPGQLQSTWNMDCLPVLELKRPTSSRVPSRDGVAPTPASVYCAKSAVLSENRQFVTENKGRFLQERASQGMSGDIPDQRCCSFHSSSLTQDDNCHFRNSICSCPHCVSMELPSSPQCDADIRSRTPEPQTPQRQASIVGASPSTRSDGTTVVADDHRIEEYDVEDGVDYAYDLSGASKTTANLLLSMKNLGLKETETGELAYFLRTTGPSARSVSSTPDGKETKGFRKFVDFGKLIRRVSSKENMAASELVLSSNGSNRIVQKVSKKGTRYLQIVTNLPSPTLTNSTASSVSESGSLTPRPVTCCSQFEVEENDGSFWSAKFSKPERVDSLTPYPPQSSVSHSGDNQTLIHDKEEMKLEGYGHIFQHFSSTWSSEVEQNFPTKTSNINSKLDTDIQHSLNFPGGNLSPFHNQIKRTASSASRSTYNNPFTSRSKATLQDKHSVNSSPSSKRQSSDLGKLELPLLWPPIDHQPQNLAETESSPKSKSKPSQPDHPASSVPLTSPVRRNRKNSSRTSYANAWSVFPPPPTASKHSTAAKHSLKPSFEARESLHSHSQSQSQSQTTVSSIPFPTSLIASASATVPLNSSYSSITEPEMTQLRAALDASEKQNRMLAAALQAVLWTAGALNGCPCGSLEGSDKCDGNCSNIKKNKRGTDDHEISNSRDEKSGTLLTEKVIGESYSRYGGKRRRFSGRSARSCEDETISGRSALDMYKRSRSSSLFSMVG